VVQVDVDEGRRRLRIPPAQPELQHAEQHARHEAVAHVGRGAQRPHRQLAEQAEHEVLQQAVPEDGHARRRLAGRRRPAADAVLHRRPHLRARRARVARRPLSIPHSSARLPLQQTPRGPSAASQS